ncbi:MAG: UDP-N-acetylmuramate--L-alanine ligase [Defluviitaleaceae bacterium]|nr:UDP-N-acetylmuramate--L-alanine ligase [Defluviitaleaceae bacterium]
MGEIIGKRVYFVGIGGVSMSGLAEIVHKSGGHACGSDRAESPATKRLEGIGITVYHGHDARNLRKEAANGGGGIDLVVFTGAVPWDNPELSAAREMGIPVMERAEFLGRMMKGYKKPVCVAGTHGKTTTTSMLTAIFLEAGLDPTVEIGGYLDSIGGNYRIGGKEFFIVESCEYKDSFLNFYPNVGVILNIDDDHLDYFGDINGVRASFRKFAGNIAEDGVLVINGGIDNLEEITGGLKCGVMTYGENGRVRAANMSHDGEGRPGFDIVKDGETAGRLNLSVRGNHNAMDALAAFCAASSLGVPAEKIISALSHYDEPKRRFEFKGMYKDMRIIDCYAHHPTAIKADLAAARASHPAKLICAFQPHTYSRTSELMDEFADCFKDADLMVFLDIYAAREENIYGVSSEQLAGRVSQAGTESVYCENFEEAEKIIEKNYIPNSMLITMGAGDIYLLGEEMLSTGL